MKQMKKIIATTLLAVMMVVTLAGCGDFDAATYVTACLDLLTTGESEDYMKMTNSTEEEAQEAYQNNIDTIMEEFGGLGLSEELTNNYEQLFKDLYKKSKYTVTGAEKMSGEDGYTVTIEIEQMTGFFDGVEDELMAQVTEYSATLTETPSTEELNEIVFQMMYDILKGRLENITYNDPETITVEVMGENNVYSITDAGYEAIDEALLDFAGLE